ncbi:MAG: magnesium transporter, partial [Rhizobiaceae bacterium]
MANDSFEELNVAPEPDEKAEHADIYTEDGAVRGDFLAMVGAAIADRDVIWLRRNVGNLHISELGDVLEAIMPEQRSALVHLLGDDFDFAALTEVDETIRLEIVDQMPNEAIAAALTDLDSDDAVYILEDLDQEDREEILAQL